MIFPRRWPTLLFVAVMSPAAWAQAPTDAGKERTDLFPQAQRWQDLPESVRCVDVDNTGRAWFELSGEVTLEQMKKQVEAGFALRAPWLQGAHLLLFDHQGRAWALPNQPPPDQASIPLLCCDPEKKTWISYPPHRDAPASPEETASIADAFDRVAHQGKNGVICVIGGRGVYTFSGEKMEYQQILDATALKRDLFGNVQLAPISLAEGEDGTVYAWTASAPGCWMHDGKRWHHFLTQVGGGSTPGIIRSLVPLQPHRLLICPAGDNTWPFILDMPPVQDPPALQAAIGQLGNPDPAVRDRANTVLLNAGAGALPALEEALEAANDAETAGRLSAILRTLSNPPANGSLDGRRLLEARTLGKDAQGNALLQGWPDQRRFATPPPTFRVSPEGKVSPVPAGLDSFSDSRLLLTHDHRTLVGGEYTGLAELTDTRLEVITAPTERENWEPLAEDGIGRIFVRDPVGRHPLAAIDLRAPEKRRGLPAEQYTLSVRMVAMDSNGHVWAALQQGAPDVSVWENGAWRPAHAPVPGNGRGFGPRGGPFSSSQYAGAQALADGAMVLLAGGAPRETRQAALFDQGNWTLYPSTQALVEASAQRLGRLLRGRQGESTLPRLLQCDGDGDIWLSDPNAPGPVVYARKQWLTLPSPPMPPGTFGNPVGSAAVIPCEGGSKLLAISASSAAVVKVEQGAIRFQPASSAVFNTRAPLSGEFVDRDGDTWIGLRDGRCARLDRDNPAEIQGLPVPQYEDRAGRFWFMDRTHRQIVVMTAAGERAAAGFTNFGQWPAITQGQPDSIWATTSVGLSHFVIRQAEGKMSVEPAGEFTYHLPRDAFGIWGDADGNLWEEAPGDQVIEGILWRITPEK